MNKISEKLSNSPILHNNQAPGNIETFQKEYISSVVSTDHNTSLLHMSSSLVFQVSEAMQEWCDGVDKRLWGFHYSLLRQLEEHQTETRMMMSEMTGMAAMRDEMQRLKHENDELRKFFGSNPS